MCSSLLSNLCCGLISLDPHGRDGANQLDGRAWPSAEARVVRATAFSTKLSTAGKRLAYRGCVGVRKPEELPVQTTRVVARRRVRVGGRLGSGPEGHRTRLVRVGGRDNRGD